MRSFALLFVLLTACAGAETPAPVESKAVDAPAATVPAAELTIAPAGEVVRTCTVDADCAVKNVGNCCGYAPACVNKDSQTFPDRVKAECESNDMMSICGFQEPAGCACVDGQCASTGASLGGGGEIE